MKLLAIDDEELTQTFIKQVLQKEHDTTIAGSGEQGIQLATELQPDLIILDVNMPGMDGYTVCKELKSDPVTADIPVLFLSANTDLEEQMKGYAVGGEDYLVKPCEPKTLQAKVNVMLRLRDKQSNLKQQYMEAQKTAHIAMVGSSEIGMAMQFVESSFLLNSYKELANAFFNFTNNLDLICAIMFFTHDGPRAYFSDGAFSPLEEELLVKMRNQKRIFDFQNRTFINYPNTTLLVKNMPIDDDERYGRIKDLLPTVLGALNSKVLTMKTSKVIESQANDLKVSYDRIKTTLLDITNSITDNANKNNRTMRTLFEDMQDFLPRLALEEDQETFILDHIEKTINDSAALNSASAELTGNLHSVVNTLQFVIDRQQAFVDELNSNPSQDDQGETGHNDATGVDFF